VQKKSVVQTVFRNITEHKKTEKELQEANRLLTEALTGLRNAQEKIIGQERLAAVGQLAAGIAHDFNNILVPINLYTEMLLLESKISESGREGLTTILEQAKRAASLTEQILDFSRSAVMDSQILNLSSFLNEFMKIIRRTLPETIFIDLVTDGDDFGIRADPARMQQVFMNLALNARDAMPRGGELRIELSRLIVKPTGPPPYRDMASGEWIRVMVSDNGVGIQPDQLQRIFEPFYTTKEPGNGTGLGLAQVYGIVKQHGGYIHVESHPEDGTIFIIYLPALAGEEEEEPTPEEETTIMGQLETILVVEDDGAAQKAVRDTLKTLNYRVLTANNGSEAMEIVERDKVDLVLSDLVMPEMGGVELFKILKKEFPEIKMLVMTGYPLKGGTKELIGRSQLDWLQKPLDMETLTTMVGKMLSKDAQ
jgi:signal transduction histidine kinase/ActR/RegA family two-component response regulator